MPSCFAVLSDEDELNAINWQTKKLSLASPAAQLAFATVISILEEHFLAGNFERLIPESGGSVAYKHKLDNPIVVRAWIDDENRLSNHFGLSLSAEPIVVGIDLAAQIPLERKLVRQFLRDNFTYIDPEITIISTPGEERKVSTMGDLDHRLDVVFITEIPKIYTVDEEAVAAVLQTIADLP
jgi:hypothetical protein